MKLVEIVEEVAQRQRLACGCKGEGVASEEGGGEIVEEAVKVGVR